ncbi:MAG: hypothetical protein J7577_13270 [Sphingobacteriaceae bacterium]|nr:hypothetical protein [Sphingobacteriaceae bacterium]
MRLPKPYFKILYNNKNITTDVSENFLSLNYKDKVSGESDEIELVLEDKSGKWVNEWYPQKGAYLNITIGLNSKILECGVFQVDEIEFTGPPDQISIKGLSTGIYGKMRTRKGYAHENKTLSEIIHTLAAKNKFTVVGSIENIRIGRSTQRRETDLQYINRLSSEYGYNFTVKGTQLVFIKQTELESFGSVLSIDKTDVMPGYSFKDKTTNIFKGTVVKFYNPNTSKVVKSERSGDLPGEDPSYSKELDTLELRGKVENEEQANAKAEAYTHRMNTLQQTGTIPVPGNVVLVAGVNFELTGFGAFSGIWHVLSSEHAIDTGGYITTAEIKRINVSNNKATKIPKTIPKNSLTYQTK